MQITCCYENFCDKHIKEEILKNFTCPNCNAAATLRDIVPNKKLRENIIWFKNLLKESPAIGTGISPQIVSTYSIIKTPPALPSEQTTKKLDIDKIADHKEADMTPEEKMQLYNKINEDVSDRKQSEDKVDVDNKSVSIEHKSVKDTTSLPPSHEKSLPHITPTGFPQPGGIPMTPMTYPQMPMMKPGDPHSMMYMRGFDPRMYYSMMSHGYPIPGYYPFPITGGEDKIKS